MDELLQHPAVQAGVGPLLIALAVAAALWRTRMAWLAVAAAYATAVALSVGFSLQPLTAGRKVTLLIVLAALLGAALDHWRAPARWLVPLLSIACGLLTWWVFASVLGQREWNERALIALGLFLFVASHTTLVLHLSDDGAAAGAVGVAGGIAVGIAALWSASIGYFVGGVAMAAGAGALMLLQFALNRLRAPGFSGTLPLAFGLALFGAASALLAQLPWFVLPLLLLVPLAAPLNPWRATAPRARLFAATGAATVAAALLVAAVWLVATGATSQPTV
jgi:hypothetical protein